ncbi:MAG: L-histidine N(alpha)-methyltransferase [Limisphaerales bacterium]
MLLLVRRVVTRDDVPDRGCVVLDQRQCAGSAPGLRLVSDTAALRWLRFHRAVVSSPMPAAVEILIHPSQFPENVRQDLLDSLRARRINHKFHYASVKQAEQWLALHDAHSPARTDPGCVSMYEQGFQETLTHLDAAVGVHVVGLGCGGGQKDAHLVRLLQQHGKAAHYTPVDVGVPLVLTAWHAALAAGAAPGGRPIVCDLLTAADLGELLDGESSAASPRIVTFFGMIPNFEPQVILPRLASLVRPGSWLLFSANLAPGADYAAGVRAVLPQYDNALTREWLLTFLLDLGVDRADGEARFFIEDDPSARPLKRITCEFGFTRARGIQVSGERFEFRAGETIRLFFSYRYTRDQVRRLLARHGLDVTAEWITPSQEEGVFLCQRE